MGISVINNYLADIDATGLLRSNLARKSAIAELVPLNSETILRDRLKQCAADFQPTKLCRTLVVDLTGSARDYVPYWNESVAEKSAKLWSPTVTDYADSVSSLWSGFARETIANSWFSTQISVHPNKKWLKTCLPSSTSFLADSMGNENILRCKRIRLFPTTEQRKKLKMWCGAARWMYNQAVEKQVSNRISVQVAMLADCPEWAQTTPYKIKQMAIEDEVIARRNGFKFAKKTGKSFQLAFRSKKMRRDSLYIPKESVTPTGVFPRLLGSMKSAELIERPVFDCKLLHNNGKFYLLVPYNKPKRENQAEGEVAVDPGVRTFLTFFSPGIVGKVGDLAINRIQRLCAWMDKLVSNKKWRAVRRIRERIRNLISELHHKAALWFVKNFSVIVIPKFDAREMTIRKSRKIGSKTARKMLTLAHGRFRNILLDKAEEWQRTIIYVSEAYTSKTCSVCGKQHAIGGKKIMDCCKKYDRDLNGARGIFLRALVDTPSSSNVGVLKETISACLELST